MIIDDLNSHLRQLIHNLQQYGFKLTAIGKVLLGSNGYTPILKLCDEHESINFGYKPLARIGRLLHKDLYMVYLNPDDNLVKILEQRNIETLNILKEKIANYLNNKEGIPNNNDPPDTTKLDSLLMSILGTNIDEEMANSDE
jgi:hypothetical protein